MALYIVNRYKNNICNTRKKRKKKKKKKKIVFFFSSKFINEKYKY